MRAGHPQIQTYHPVAPDVVHAAPFLLGSTCCPGAVASSTTALHSPRCSASAARGSHSCAAVGPGRAGQPTSLRRVPWQVSEKAINRTRRPPQGPSEPDLWRLPEPAGPTHATRNPGRDQQPGTPYMSRWRMVRPLLASSGLAPARAANAALHLSGAAHGWLVSVRCGAARVRVSSGSGGWWCAIRSRRPSRRAPRAGTAGAGVTARGAGCGGWPGNPGPGCCAGRR